MKIVVGGCRDFFDYSLISSHLDALLEGYPSTDTIVFLSGHCSGVDQLTERYAAEHCYSVMLFPAEWNRYGRAAGPIRNKSMVEIADHIVAFWDGHSRGTASLIRLARKSGKPVTIVQI